MREVGREGGKEYSFMYKFYEENKQEFEIRNNGMDLFRIEKLDKFFLKWFNLSLGLKVKKKLIM